MPKYRKKPVVVEAIQYLGLNAEEVKSFVGEACELTPADPSFFIPHYNVIIHTLEGDMKVDVGDFVIKGVKGEFYPCKPDIFTQIYEIDNSSSATEAMFKKFGTTEKEYIARSMNKVHIEMEIANYMKDWRDDEEIGLHLSTDYGDTQITLEDVRDLARHFIEFAQSELMKEAVNGRVEYVNGFATLENVVLHPADFKNCEKVSVIIIKKEK